MIQLFLMIKLLLNLLMIFFTNIGINLAAESDQLYNNLGDDPNFHQHFPETRFHFSDISVSNVALRLQNLKASKATGVNSIYYRQKFLRRHHTSSLHR